MAIIHGLHAMDGLRTAEQIELLDLVDSLRAEGLSEFTALPQLIVCGDQSSGKSSLLKAISGVPFPRKDNLCTRFATEVILRRASESDIKVSLAPGKSRSAGDKDRLLQFQHKVSSHGEYWVWVNNAPCAHCLAEGRDLDNTPGPLESGNGSDHYGGQEKIQIPPFSPPSPVLADSGV